MTGAKCLICGDIAPPREIGKLQGRSECEKTCINLQAELSVFLLLRTILRISQVHLELLLQKHGNPSSWGINLCPPCNRIFIEAEFVHQRLVKLNDEFNELTRTLRKQIKGSESTISGLSTSKQKCRSRRKSGKKGKASVPIALDNEEEALDPFGIIRLNLLKVKTEKKTTKPSLDVQLPTENFSNESEEFSLRKVKAETPDCRIERCNSEVVLEDTTINDHRITRTLSHNVEPQPEPNDSQNADNGESNDIPGDDDYIPSPDMDNDDNDNDTDYESDNNREPKAANNQESKPDPDEVDPFSGPQPIKLRVGHYKCPICGRRAISKSSSHGHILRAHFNASRPFHCHLCHERFRREVILRQHLVDVHGGAPTPLDDPEECKPLEASELSVPHSANRKRTFKCEICPSSKKHKVLYGSQATLDAHKKIVHEGIKRPYSCKLCGKSFKVHSMFRHHMFVHRRQEKEKKNTLQEQPFCHECNESFKTTDSLRIHLRYSRRHLKTQEYPFQCELCPKGYYQKNSLENHHAQEHFEQLNLEPFKCTLCGSILSSRRALNHHIRIRHTKDTLFRCDRCDVGFMFAHTYKLHMTNVHVKEKPLLCSYCPKRFASKNHLETHTRIHTGEKPFKCPHCAKEYSDRPTYKRHIETHGEQVYKCSICDNKEFKVWHSYRLHMKTHNQDLHKKPPPIVVPTNTTADAMNDESQSQSMELKIQSEERENTNNLLADISENFSAVNNKQEGSQVNIQTLD